MTWPGAGGWLRVTLIAAIVAALATIAFDFAVSEPIVDRTVRLWEGGEMPKAV